jgi:hypothetical protein
MQRNPHGKSFANYSFRKTDSDKLVPLVKPKNTALSRASIITAMKKTRRIKICFPPTLLNAQRIGHEQKYKTNILFISKTFQSFKL